MIESASVQEIVRDIVDCFGSNCGNVPEKSICLDFSGHFLLLTCFGNVNSVLEIKQINNKFSNLGCHDESSQIDKRMEVDQPALLHR